MSSFSQANRRIAGYRASLLRDLQRGRIAVDAREMADACLWRIEGLLHTARADVEGAPIGAELAEPFAEGCCRLAARVFLAAYSAVPRSPNTRLREDAVARR